MAKADIKGRLGLDSTGFQRGLQKSKQSLSKFGKSVVRVSNRLAKMGLAGAAAGVALLSKKVITLGSRISDLSDQLRINTADLQSLQVAAMEAGVEQGSFERALRNVTQRSQEAIEGNTNYADSFGILNINAREFANLPTEEKLKAISKALAESGESQAAFNAVANILGKTAGPQMIEVLRRINDEGLTELEKKARSAGLVLDDSVIKKMDGLSDSMERLGLRLKVLVGNLIADLIPKLQVTAKFIEKNADAFKTLARVVLTYVAATKAARVVIPIVSKLLIFNKAAAFGASAATFTLAGAMKVLKRAVQGLMGATGIGLLVVALGELGLIALDAAKKTNQGAGDMSDDYDEASKSIESNLDKVKKAIGETETAQNRLNASVKSYTQRIKEQAELEKIVADAQQDRIDSQRELVDEQRNAVIQAKELEALQLRSAGKNAEAEKLEEQIEKTKEAIKISDKFGISLKESVKLVKGISANKDTGGGGGGGGTDTGSVAAIANSALTGQNLRREANRVGKDENIRFEKQGDGGFQRFVDGVKSGKFTEEQLQKGVGGKKAEAEKQREELKEQTKLLKTIEKEMTKK